MAERFEAAASGCIWCRTRRPVPLPTRSGSVGTSRNGTTEAPPARTPVPSGSSGASTGAIGGGGSVAVFVVLAVGLLFGPSPALSRLGRSCKLLPGSAFDLIPERPG